MFPGAYPKTSMHDAFFKFLNVIDRKTALHNIFINRIVRYTHKNNAIDRRANQCWYLFCK